MLHCDKMMTNNRLPTQPIRHQQRSHNVYTPTQPKCPDFPTDDGRMDDSPHTRELQTKAWYQKKRKTMHYPMVLSAAVKFHHGDQRDDKPRSC